ncbi:OprD family outer membrane porin [Daejeonella oryzae]|uniref:OprD family outer membrane porin n=1 Tax=Daejeonella oryzae TaxID=1122943 RepID=UPI000406CAC3|nr:OprD family outer membrane porin [Daejeonella oryzae]
MKKIMLAVMLILFTGGTMLFAQNQEIAEQSEIEKSEGLKNVDSTSLLSALKKAQIDGHFRYFFMATDNKKGLTDYYANAVGGSIRYETAPLHGFQLALSGSYIYNMGSSDFTLADSVTGQLNRYESSLFDIQDPANKKFITRLEEVHLKYNYKKSSATAGRQLINTPFINLQDGRMRSTGVEGLYIEFNEIKNTKIEGGWLYAISPRGTTKWYNTGESMGIYPAGLNTDGTKSAYLNSIESKSAAILGISTNINNLKLQAWDLFSENVFNTAMLQADLMFPIKNKSSVFASAQLIRQDAVNDGGNPDAARTYFEKGGKAVSLGTRAGWRNKIFEASLNYNRITAHGRYLMPREWGREPFFTFLPRERNEGFGDVHAFMAKVNYNIPRSGMNTSLSAGYYQMPDVKNYKLNKYGLPSYTQINADARYSFTGTFKGLEAQFLIAGKINNGKTYDNTRFEINKVNILQYNFVLNYHF